MNRRELFRYIFLGLASLIILVWSLFPLYWLVVSTISSDQELRQLPPHIFPHHPSLENYANILFGSSSNVRGFRVSLGNSLIVSLIATAIILILASSAAYVFTRYRFRGRGILFVGLIYLNMIPLVAVIIPFYIIANALGLIDTKLALIVFYSGMNLMLAIWLMRNYFLTLPLELEEAAVLDGCSPIQVLFKVVLPLARPGLSAVGILTFLAIWNEFFLALIITFSEKSQTFPVMLLTFSGRYVYNFAMTNTGALLGLVPPLGIMIIFNHFIISGLTAGYGK